MKRAFAENRPWDQVAREVLLGRANSKDRGHLWFLYEQDNKHQEIAESISRAFFGIDIQCAQCHDHPIAGEIKQQHYWGLVSFFRRSKNVGAANGFAIGESAIGGFDEFSNALSGGTQPAVLTFFQSKVVPEQRPVDPSKQKDKDENYVTVSGEPKIPQFSRRQEFVDQILAEHPLIARCTVNQIWGLLIGRGIVHPADQMDSAHPPSHPELLDWLARDFAAHHYDVRRLVRSIVLSDVYQLSSTGALEDPARFSSAHLKPLNAHAILRSLAIVLQVPEQTIGSLGPEIRKQFPDVLPGPGQTTLKQALMLSNHPRFNELIAQTSAKIDAGQAEQYVEGLFFRAFGREIDADERDHITQYIESRSDNVQQALGAIIWATVTSAEFRFNH